MSQRKYQRYYLYTCWLVKKVKAIIIIDNFRPSNDIRYNIYFLFSENTIDMKNELTPVGWVDGIEDIFADIYSVLSKVDNRICTRVEHVQLLA